MRRSALVAARTFSTSVDAVNPYTGSLAASFPADDDLALVRKFVRATEAQARWRETPMRERVACVERYAELLRGEADAAALELTTEMGKPLTQARSEVLAACRRATELARLALATFGVDEGASPRLRPRVVREGARLVETVEFEPVGVVAHVSAWNYPHLLAANVLAPALAVGAVALHKPSEATPSVGARVERLLRDAGVPDGVFQTCQGGPAVGRALASLRGVGALAFTGSRRSGRDAALSAARAETPRTVLELGGNDAAYVREDVENVVDAARSIADGAFLNAGQGCCAVERVYCHAAVADAFVDAFLERASTFVAGDPKDPRTTLGPMATRDGPRRVAAHVAEAVETGAKILYRGAHDGFANGGFFHPATVVGGDALRGSQRARALTRDETFGPAVAVVVVRDDEEAVEAMADTSFGLTASVYTSDAEVGTTILRRLDVGTGYLNACNATSGTLPWGGRAGSGHGATLGREGVETFVRHKSMYTRW